MNALRGSTMGCHSACSADLLQATHELMHFAAAQCNRRKRQCAMAFALLLPVSTAALAQTQFSSTTAPSNAQRSANSNSSGTYTSGTSLSQDSGIGNVGGQIQLLDNRSLTGQMPLQGQSSYFQGQDVAPPVYQPSEFELYVQTLTTPLKIHRLGAELMLPSRATDGQEASPLVPPDYLLVPGDEVALAIWGSVDADLKLVVDKSGRIVIPRVGPIMVAGVRYADLPAVISKRVDRLFKNFELSVSLGQLRGIRVFVTGFVARAGTYSMTSLSTLSAALIKAGGPTAAGSFRDIQLRRNGKVISNFDLYDLIVNGDRAGDLTLQPDDVVHVGPIGPQVAVIGSVNQPSVLELKPGDNIQNMLRMAGGMTSVADESRLSIERLVERNGSKVSQVSLPDAASQTLGRGDVLRIFSAVDAKLPIGRQNKRVTIEGEVRRPGTYVMPASSSVQDALNLAGGFAPNAFVFGTQFTRKTVREEQQDNYERALRDLETSLISNTTTQRTATADEAKAQEAQASATSRLIDRLRRVKPTGRVVLQLSPGDSSLPNLTLEDEDRIYIPAVPTSVGVFGSVFNTGNYLYAEQRQVSDYLKLAGGPTRGADKDSTFIIRANGSVVSILQDSSWLSSGDLSAIAAYPGDTVFVPEELNKTTFMQNAKDWTQIIYQLGLGAAAINALK